MHAIKLCFGYVVPLVLGYKIMPGGRRFPKTDEMTTPFVVAIVGLVRRVKLV